MKQVRFPQWIILFLSCVLFGTVLGVSSVQADPVIHYVAPSGDCGGASPCYSTIQAAVNAAVSYDEIRVATGTYSQVSTGNGYTAVIWIVNKKITLTGGYTTANWNTSNPAANPTVIDPNDNGVGIYVNYQLDTSYGNVIIDGFSITDGSATDAGAGTDSGGGIFIRSTTHIKVIIQNCKIYENFAEDGSGGGIWAFNSDNLDVIECQIYANEGDGVATSLSNNPAVIDSVVENNAGHGIAVYTDYGDHLEIRGNEITGHSDSGIVLNSVTGGMVTDNLISDNLTTGGGGGLDISGAAVVISNNIIRNNSAAVQGGGIDSGTGVEIKNNLIESNSVTLNIGNGGGGLYVDAGSGGTATVSNNQVYSNTSPPSAGGMMVLGDVTVSGNTIMGNTANTGSGGGIQASAMGVIGDNLIRGNTAKFGGGIDVPGSFGLLIEGNRMIDNQATNGDGGGLRITSGIFDVQVTIDSNQVISNTASGKGGGIYLECPTDNEDPIDISNTVLADNLAAAGSGLYSTVCELDLAYNTVSANRGSWGDGIGFYMRDPAGSDAVYAIENTIMVKQTVGVYVESGSASLEATFWGSSAWANDANTGGSGTIDLGTFTYQGDPSFVDSANNDYHITENSPVIDKGIDTWVTNDMDGQSRPAGETDIGADEYGQLSLIYLPLLLR